MQLNRLRDLTARLRLVLEKRGWELDKSEEDNYIALLNAGLVKTATHIYRARTGAHAKIAERYIASLIKRIK